MSADPAVSVTIPRWNGRSLLDVCLPSLGNQSRRDFEVIVVDNGSTDGTEAYLRESWPAVHYVEKSRRLQRELQTVRDTPWPWLHAHVQNIRKFVGTARKVGLSAAIAATRAYLRLHRDQC